jgi:molybdopterin-synthase adenylyltransferase
MKTIIVSAAAWADTQKRLQASTEESCAVFLTRPGATSDAILVRTELSVPDDAYSKRSPVAAELKAAFLFDATERARVEQSALLFVHTHPQTVGQPRFSNADDAGEIKLKAYLDLKLPARAHASLILAPDGCCTRILGGEDVSLKEVGSGVRFLCEPFQADETAYKQIFDRQVRAFGAAGQRLIARTKVGLVGVGGTGSVAAQELAYLGVRKFVLIDDKVLDETNLNRVVSAMQADIGTPKVELCQRLIHRINDEAEVDAVLGTVLNPDCLERLAGCDFIFLCTDNHASRLEVCHFCYRYLIPAIDMGVAIGTEQGRVSSVAGRIQMIAPDLPCLICTKSISADEVRRETMSPEQRAADPYFSSAGEPQPSVISLNSTVSSLAVTMFVAAITGLPIESRHLRYDALRSKVYPLAAQAHPTCLICSPGGELGAGREAASW